MAFVAVAMGHDLTYVLTHVDARSLEHALEGAHSGYWSSFVMTTALAAAALSGVVMVQLRRLALQARRFGDLALVPDGTIRILVRLFCRWWLGLIVTSLAIYLLLENVERLATGEALPLLGAVIGDQWLAIPILSFISLALAAVSALVRWRRIVLLARLSGQRRSWPRVSAVITPHPDVAVPAPVADLRAHGLRAPPAARQPA